MKFSLFIFALIIQTTVIAAEKGIQLPEYVITSDKINKKLKPDEAVFIFKIPEHLNTAKQVVYSINGEEKTVELNKKQIIREKVQPGTFEFEFLYSLRHHEISIDSIHIESQHEITIQLNFRPSRQNIHVRKPVIYLYPDSTTNVTVEVEAKGELSFVYPEYNGAWNVKASPDGTIEHNNETYNYLFWESEQSLSQVPLNRNEGFIIHSSELLPFLETSLEQFGFNGKERADFITYWVPHMNAKTNLYIYFLFNEKCDAFASLKISPKPTEIARFYMLWTEVGPNFNSDGIHTQEIPKMDRTGFTVLEWGGAEINVTDEQEL